MKESDVKPGSDRLHVQPQRVLRTWDIVLFYIVAIVGFRWIAVAAAVGPSSLALWILAVLVFFVPLGLAVIALSSAMPREGGLYVWTTDAFGPCHGFLAGWCYWVCNITYYPTLAISTAVYALHIFNTKYADLEYNHSYIVFFSLTVLGVAFVLNIIGLRTGRWVQNLGGLAQWFPLLVLIAVGVFTLTTQGSKTPMPPSSFLPSFTDVDKVKVFSYICFAVAGLELAPLLAEEVFEPAKTLPRSINISGILIAVCYLSGTLALLWALDHKETDLIAAISRAVEKQGLWWLSPPVAVSMTIAGLGGFGAWLIGPTRLLLAGGANCYLPSAFARIHPKWNTPHVALTFQAALAAIFVIIYAFHSNIDTAYRILINSTLILYFIPFLYIFAAAIRLRRKIASTASAIPIPGGRLGSWVVNCSGFVTTLFATIMAIVPDAEVSDQSDFIVNVSMDSFILLAIGFIFYLNAKRRRGA